MMREGELSEKIQDDKIDDDFPVEQTPNQVELSKSISSKNRSKKSSDKQRIMMKEHDTESASSFGDEKMVNDLDEEAGFLEADI